MPRRLQEYLADAITVTFDPNLCIHARRCVTGLPAVFDVRRRKWIEPGAAPAADIVEVIQRCPSGALQYHRLDGSRDEQPDAEGSLRPQPNGPLYVRGAITILDAEDGVLAEGTRFALCRCGGSRNKPFCDNSHIALGFTAR